MITILLKALALAIMVTVMATSIITTTTTTTTTTITITRRPSRRRRRRPPRHRTCSVNTPSARPKVRRPRGRRRRPDHRSVTSNSTTTTTTTISSTTTTNNISSNSTIITHHTSNRSISMVTGVRRTVMMVVTAEAVAIRAMIRVRLVRPPANRRPPTIRCSMCTSTGSHKPRHAIRTTFPTLPNAPRAAVGLATTISGPTVSSVRRWPLVAPAVCVRLQQAASSPLWMMRISDTKTS
uniref:Uncharacterized protein n=1 Tax=Anopheles darlingi TaxID=43151 RepID=A0A2M4D3M3_ANODA